MVEVVSSGQAELPALANAPESWSTAALVVLIVCKAIGYAVCLGAFRGGQAFPALFLGAATGVVAGAAVPALDPVAALSVGMAAGAAVTGLPVTSVLLVVLLLGDSAAPVMPAIIVAVVTALVIEEFLRVRRAAAPVPA